MKEQKNNSSLLDNQKLIDLFYMMKKIRLVEERIASEYPKNEIRCPTHLSIGQEGVPAALSICLNNADYAVSTHRGHAHYLSKGGNLNKMIAEIYGKKSGCSGGKGGSMHLIDKEVGFMGTSAIVGNSIPVGVGLGLALKLNKARNVSCIFLGDGAIEEGSFYESLNFAVLKELPIIFVCENNLYSVYSPLNVRQPKNRKIRDLAKSIGAKTHYEDGNDVINSYKCLNSIISQIRSKDVCTWFIEFETYRWREHCGYQFDNDLGYRTIEEYEQWKKRDPIKLFENNLKKDFPEFDFHQLDEITANITKEIDIAFEKAKNDSYPEKYEAFKNVYSNEI
tara:strand:+ start:1542 stop:2552 length:1011 start_codon:yes stop_codon:yes gene_type:complete